MQLRNVHGQLATAVEEHSILCRFVRDVWSGDPTAPAHPGVVAGTPFSEQDVRQALSTIPISRAIAPGLFQERSGVLLLIVSLPGSFPSSKLGGFKNNPTYLIAGNMDGFAGSPNRGNPPRRPLLWDPYPFKNP